MKLKKKNIYKYNLGLWFLKNIPNLINSINLKKDELIIYTTKKNIIDLLFFLKNHKIMKFQTLIDITAVDYQTNLNQFELSYFLLSVQYNLRLCLKIFANKTTFVPSITSIFNSANWYERETWDMYGIFFTNHPDLRRLLTDYGFEGFPFRKDFPQSGYIQIQYDDTKKYIVYKPLKITQEYRLFNFNSPWLKKKIKKKL